MEYLFLIFFIPVFGFLFYFTAIVVFACERCRSFKKREIVIHRDRYGRYSELKYCETCCNEIGA